MVKKKKVATPKQRRHGGQSSSMLARNVNRDSGNRISVEKYEAVRKLLLKLVPKSKEGIAFRDLPALVARELPKDMQPARGSASWLVTVVKLDLEARGILQRLPGVVPQRLRRVK